MSFHSPIAGTVDLDSLRSTVPSLFSTTKHFSRSDKFTVIPTIDTVRAMVDNGFVITAARQARARSADRVPFVKHMVRLRINNLAKVGDVSPEVILTNAHDGTSAEHLYSGLFRLACLNGMVVSIGQADKISIPHRGDVAERALEAALEIMSRSRQLGDVWQSWTGINLTTEAQHEFAKRALALRWVPDEQGRASTAVQPQQLLTVRRDDDKGDNLWHVFNRVQENLTQGGLEYTSVTRTESGQRIRRLRSRPVRGISEDIGLNQKLWGLAEEFAKQAA